MSTLSAVASAWDALVFQHASIAAISAKALPYEHTEESQTELSALRHNQKINFWEYVIGEGREITEVGNTTPRRNITAEVRYTREKDVSGAAHTAVRDALETLHDIVSSELGTTWNGTVDFGVPDGGVSTPESDAVAGVPVWRGVARFQARKSE